MALPENQERVEEFVRNHALQVPLHSQLLDLCAEVGEVAKEGLIGTNYGQETFHMTDGWVEELGDVYYSLIRVANATGTNLEAALEAVLRKYQGRIQEEAEVGG